MVRSLAVALTLRRTPSVLTASNRSAAGSLPLKYRKKKTAGLERMSAAIRILNSIPPVRKPFRHYLWILNMHFTRRHSPSLHQTCLPFLYTCDSKSPLPAGTFVDLRSIPLPLLRWQISKYLIMEMVAPPDPTLIFPLNFDSSCA